MAVTLNDHRVDFVVRLKLTNVPGWDLRGGCVDDDPAVSGDLPTASHGTLEGAEDLLSKIPEAEALFAWRRRTGLA